MQVAVFGDQRATVAPDWTEETAVALAGDVLIDASRGIGSGARLTFIGIAGDLVIRVPRVVECEPTGSSSLVTM